MTDKNPSLVSVALPDGTVRHIRCGGDRPPDQRLSDWLEENGVPLNTRCGGRGLCNGCKVWLAADSLPESGAGDVESPDAGQESEAGDSRLVRSCGLRLRDFPGHTPPNVRVPEASLRDHGLHGVIAFELRTALPLPDRTRPGLGFAVDVGTTTVAAALWDFSSGQCLGSASRQNGQARFGDNVLSRISFSLEADENSARLKDALVLDTLQPLLTQLLRDAGRDPGDVVDATVSGNPVMLHTLIGETLSGFSRFPFRPVFLDQREVPLSSMGLADSAGTATLLPGLGAFVGADILAGAVAAGLHECAAPVLLIDFGTNGEILLKTDTGFLATATAAGPAFEGGRLLCGSAARNRVVSALYWKQEEGWSWRTSGGGGEGHRPRGIAGSAYIDFLAQARAAGFLSPFGRLDADSPFVDEVEEDDEVSRRSTIAPGVFVAETDIAELMQAKAAIGGGVAALLEEAGIKATDLRAVYVAGGFGYHLNPANAMAVGLLPDVDPAKVQIIGNASLGGASLLLLRAADPILAAIRAKTRAVELNQVSSFSDLFTDCLSLEPFGDSL